MYRCSNQAREDWAPHPTFTGTQLVERKASLKRQCEESEKRRLSSVHALDKWAKQEETIMAKFARCRRADEAAAPGEGSRTRTMLANAIENVVWVQEYKRKAEETWALREEELDSLRASKMEIRRLFVIACNRLR